MMIKRFVAILLTLAICSFALCSCGDSKGKKYDVEIEVENYGVIKAELDSTYAPKTVENFLKLVNRGFYNGLSFHRIISGFMIQGGSPTYDTSGRLSETIKGEFSANGVENPNSHTRGALSMARPEVYDGASCQFFIVHEDSEFLDGKYAVFGYVTEGMDVVDAICDNTTVEDGNGTVLLENQPIIKEIRVVSENK